LVPDQYLDCINLLLPRVQCVQSEQVEGGTMESIQAAKALMNTERSKETGSVSDDESAQLSVKRCETTGTLAQRLRGLLV